MKTLFDVDITDIDIFDSGYMYMRITATAIHKVIQSMHKLITTILEPISDNEYLIKHGSNGNYEEIVRIQFTDSEIHLIYPENKSYIDINFFTLLYKKYKISISKIYLNKDLITISPGTYVDSYIVNHMPDIKFKSTSNKCIISACYFKSLNDLMKFVKFLINNGLNSVEINKYNVNIKYNDTSLPINSLLKKKEYKKLSYEVDYDYPATLIFRKEHIDRYFKQ